MPYFFLLFMFISSFLFSQIIDIQPVDTIWKKQNNKKVQILEDPVFIDTIANFSKPILQQLEPIKLEKVQFFRLKNGLRVYVLARPSDAFVQYALHFYGTPQIDDDFIGIQELTSDLMQTGTTKRSKEKLQVDLASLNAEIKNNNSLLHLKGLKKNDEQLLELFSEMVLFPSFSVEEMSILKAQKKAQIALSNDRADEVLNRISAKINYANSPSTNSILTEEIVQSSTAGDCKIFYESYLKPNLCYLGITGDVDVEELKIRLEQLLGTWEANTKNTFSTPSVTPPAKTIFSILNNDYHPLAHLALTHTIPISPNHPDAFKLKVLNAVLGETIFSRLQQQLVDQKKYVSTVHSQLTQDVSHTILTIQLKPDHKYIDSTIQYLLKALHSLQNEKNDWREIVSAKNYLIGDFISSLEDPQTLIQIAINTDRWNLPPNYYQDYLYQLNRVSIKDVFDAANKYLRPGKAHIVIVGNKNEILNSITKIKQIPYQILDVYGNKEDDIQHNKWMALNAKSVIQNYIKAIGGKTSLRKINSIYTTQEATSNNQIMVIEKIKKMPDKYLLRVKVGEIIVQEILFNGINAVEKNSQMLRNIKGREFDLLENDVYINPEKSYDTLLNHLVLKGIEKINDEMTYVVEIMNKKKRIIYEYFSVNTNLKVRTLIPPNANISGRSQTITYAEYKPFDNVLFPTSIVIKNPESETMVSVKSIRLNEKIADDLFTIQ